MAKKNDDNDDTVWGTLAHQIRISIHPLTLSAPAKDFSEHVGTLTSAPALTSVCKPRAPSYYINLLPPFLGVSQIVHEMSNEAWRRSTHGLPTN